MSSGYESWRIADSNTRDIWASRGRNEICFRKYVCQIGRVSTHSRNSLYVKSFRGSIAFNSSNVIFGRSNENVQIQVEPFSLMDEEVEDAEDDGAQGGENLDLRRLVVVVVVVVTSGEVTTDDEGVVSVADASKAVGGGWSMDADDDSCCVGDCVSAACDGGDDDDDDSSFPPLLSP